MNIKEFDILKTLLKKPFTTQRDLAEMSGHSLGAVNQALKRLEEDGFLTDEFRLKSINQEEISAKCNYPCGWIRNENGADRLYDIKSVAGGKGRTPHRTAHNSAKGSGN